MHSNVYRKFGPQERRFFIFPARVNSLSDVSEVYVFSKDRFYAMFGGKSRVLSYTPTPKPFGKEIDDTLDFVLCPRHITHSVTKCVSDVSPTIIKENPFYSPTVNERFSSHDRVVF